jgi:hypothetical protein
MFFSFKSIIEMNNTSMIYLFKNKNFLHDFLLWWSVLQVLFVDWFYCSIAFTKLVYCQIHFAKSSFPQDFPNSIEVNVRLERSYIPFSLKMSSNEFPDFQIVFRPWGNIRIGEIRKSCLNSMDNFFSIFIIQNDWVFKGFSIFILLTTCFILLLW